jgi:hypothetical protein
MTIDEKITHSTNSEVKLHKEGVFCVAYEQSDYVCALHKKLNVSKRYVKKLSGEIVNLFLGVHIKPYITYIVSKQKIKNATFFWMINHSIKKIYIMFSHLSICIWA